MGAIRAVFASIRQQRDLLYLVLGLSLFFLGVLPFLVYEVDGQGMLAVADSVVRSHSIMVPERLGVPGRDGAYYAQWYPLLSFALIPAVALGALASALFHLPAHYVECTFALAFNAAVSTGTAGVIFHLSRSLGSSRLMAFTSAVSYTFGTIAIVYARSLFAEPLLALITVSTIAVALNPKGLSWRSAALLGVLAALAALAKPSGALVGVSVAVYLALTNRERLLAAGPVLGTIVGLILYGFYNYARFSSFSDPGYAPGVSLLNLPAGVSGLLLSPGRGLLWYSPVTVLAILALRGGALELRRGAALVGLVFLGYLVISASVPYWDGGLAWGPRYLLPALPGLFALIAVAATRHTRILVTLTLLGAVVNFPTLISLYQRYEYEEYWSGGRADQHWLIARAPIVGVWGSMARTLVDANKTDVREIVRNSGTPNDPFLPPSEVRSFRLVPIWWWMLPLFGIPRWLGLVAGLGLVTLSAVVLARAMLLAKSMDAEPAGSPVYT